MKHKPESVGRRPSVRTRAQAIRVLEHACSSAGQSMSLSLHLAGDFLDVPGVARRLAYRAEQACTGRQYLSDGDTRREYQAEAALWLAEGWHP